MREILFKISLKCKYTTTVHFAMGMNGFLTMINSNSQHVPAILDQSIVRVEDEDENEPFKVKNIDRQILFR